ncbi:20096_t:CDS:2, partial [Funneliformis geosporum]
RLESAGTFQRNSLYLNQLHIDHGRLLSAVLNRRQMGSNPIIVGSRPPLNDSLWDRIESQGYDIVVFDQNIENKENKVDMELGASAMDVIWTRDPGIFVLVSGDGDYFPVVKRALNHNWKVETWFWQSGVSGDLTECSSSFYPLDNYYKYFTYAYGQDPVGKNHILEITDGETVGNWKGEEFNAK